MPFLATSPALHDKFFPLTSSNRGATMRSFLTLALIMCAVTARADEASRLERQISKCLVLPAVTPDIPGFKADFQVVLSRTGKLETITVTSYSPRSEVAKSVADGLSLSIRKCWPPGVKNGPVNIHLDGGEWR
ncbi:hypothetical protein [Mesorhizobium sp.]|uniref:hypothetical protein n=1 Tax=Mesorhizobium sp. TaxID=1871066 RepID=UPI001220FE10|nr:hypothetical protein [Mesorhizobium sp.]TIN79747.1 MAG: hypothetical protein E5Y09_04735 [Mesorhizobium sp.]